MKEKKLKAKEAASKALKAKKELQEKAQELDGKKRAKEQADKERAEKEQRKRALHACACQPTAAAGTPFDWMPARRSEKIRFTQRALLASKSTPTSNSKVDRTFFKREGGTDQEFDKYDTNKDGVVDYQKFQCVNNPSWMGDVLGKIEEEATVYCQLDICASIKRNTKLAGEALYFPQGAAGNAAWSAHVKKVRERCRQKCADSCMVSAKRGTAFCEKGPRSFVCDGVKMKRGTDPCPGKKIQAYCGCPKAYTQVSIVSVDSCNDEQRIRINKHQAQKDLSVIKDVQQPLLDWTAGCIADMPNNRRQSRYLLQDKIVTAKPAKPQSVLAYTQHCYPFEWICAGVG